MNTMNKLKMRDRVIIKPHPRELNLDKYRKYGCKIIEDKTRSIESIISSSNQIPAMVVSLYSSSMISLNLIYGIKTVSLVHFLLRTSISKWIKKDLRRYVKLFSGVVCFPMNQNELFKLIRES